MFRLVLSLLCSMMVGLCMILSSLNYVDGHVDRAIYFIITAILFKLFEIERLVMRKGD